jgi:PAS domain S-box-containing protein
MEEMIPPSEAQMLERFHDSVLIRDNAGTVIFWNAASVALYQWPASQAIGRNALELLKCQHPDPPEVANAHVLSEGQWRGELLRTTATGELRLVQVHWSLRQDSAGNAVGVMETAQDISATRAIELKLKESEYRYRNLFQAMAASFWELDFTIVGAKVRELLRSGVVDLEAYFSSHPETVWEYLHDTKIIDVNDHTIRLFGRGNRDEMLGPSSKYWPESSIQTYARCVAAAVARKPNCNEVTRLKTLDGAEIEVLFTACFSEENVARGIILIGVIDLSAQVAARHAVERMRAELNHAARITTLGELTASIAHEVSQPIASISTYADAGLRWLARDMPDLREIKIALHTIAQDTVRATEVIGRIRSMAVRKPTMNAELYLNSVIRESLQFLRQEIKECSIQITLDLDPTLRSFYGDRVLIQQVIVNLTMNAVQEIALADPDVKNIFIKSRQVDDRWLQIELTDSGRGITLENIPRLFDSFFTTKKSGMGMGLAICRSIIEAAGGTITLGNRIDGESGAQLLIRLPVYDGRLG